MTARRLQQLAWVALNDAEAIEDSYAWPPRPPMTEEERAEAERLRSIADAAFSRAEAMGCTDSGTDAVFGGQP